MTPWLGGGRRLGEAMVSPAVDAAMQINDRVWQASGEEKEVVPADIFPMKLGRPL